MEMHPSQMISRRILSLDAFRGFTIAGMLIVNNPGSWTSVYSPLKHAEWHGFTFADTIFPFFLWILGASIPVSLFLKREQENHHGIHSKIIKRAIILFLLGIFLNGFPFGLFGPGFDAESLRIPGVLQRIAACYAVAALIILHVQKRIQVSATIAILILYWLVLVLVPVPGIGAGVLEKGKNLPAYIDHLLLGGHLWKYTKTWDPEGLLATLPAIASTLIGAQAGYILVDTFLSPGKKILIFLATGTALLLSGLCLSAWMPINKSLWTSTYCLTMSGFAFIAFSFFFFFIEICLMKRLALPCAILGVNAITAFVLSSMIARSLSIAMVAREQGKAMSLQEYIYHIFLLFSTPKTASLFFAAGILIFIFIIAFIMWKKKITIKI